MVATVQKLHYEALKTLKSYVFQPFVNGPYQGCYLDPFGGFIASHAPELHWQLTSRVGDPCPK